jgi:hypothetical protein
MRIKLMEIAPTHCGGTLQTKKYVDGSSLFKSISTPWSNHGLIVRDVNNAYILWAPASLYASSLASIVVYSLRKLFDQY